MSNRDKYEEMSKEEFAKEYQEACEKLREDEEAWEEYQKELEAWEHTVADGLDFEEDEDE